MPRAKAAQAGRKGPAKRQLAEQFAAGEIITDMSQKAWKLGPPFGQGGFGCLYLGKCMVITSHQYKDSHVSYEIVSQLSYCKVLLIICVEIVWLFIRSPLVYK